MNRAEYKSVCHAHREARHHNRQFEYSDSPSWALAHYGKIAPQPPLVVCRREASWNHRQERRRSLVMLLVRTRRSLGL